MYKIALCDDDPVYITYLRQIINKSRIDDITVEFFEYHSGEELVKNLERYFDVIFLDIQMKNIDGNETARRIREKDSSVLLVFCTGVQMPSPASFKVQPFRYLLKQFSDKKMQCEIIEVINEMKRRRMAAFIIGNHRGEQIKLSVHDILYISVVKRGCEIWINKRVCKYQIEDNLLIAEKLNAIYDSLSEYGFEYAHNSYIVNLEYVVRIGNTQLELIDGTKLSISRSKTKYFHERFADFFSGKHKE